MYNFKVKKSIKRGNYKVYLQERLIGCTNSVYGNNSIYCLQVFDKESTRNCLEIFDYNLVTEVGKIEFILDYEIIPNWAKGTFLEFAQTTSSIVSLKIPITETSIEKEIEHACELIKEHDAEWTSHEVFMTKHFCYDFSERKKLKNDSSCRSVYEKVVNKTLDKLWKLDAVITASKVENSVLTIYSFPKEIKHISIQYLEYFVQFLSDIGIEAKSHIREHMQNTLFSITPINSKEEALLKIKKALEIYLALPYQPDLELLVEEKENIAISQLYSQIQFFKSQLILSQTTIQAKDAIIIAQESTIRTLQLGSFPEMNNKINPSQKEKNEESLFGDIIKVTEYQIWGVKINLPKLIRIIKRKL